MSGNLIANATTTATGSSINIPADGRKAGFTIQGTVVGTGAVTATIIVECSNDNVNWLTLGTITLSGTTSATDGFASVAWPYVRARVTAISGTGATINVELNSN